MTPAEVQAHPLGVALAIQLAQLPANELDQLLARCSVQADNICGKRLQAPGTSTLTLQANANVTSISVASTLTLDDLAEQAVILDPGTGIQEIVLIQPGGVNVSSWVSPYPGTIELATPLQFTHSNGATVQYAYREVSETITASQSDPYSEALMSQAAQLALAHLPPIHIGLNRISFLKNYPISTVYTLEHAYSFDTTYNLIYSSSDITFAGQIIIEPTAGFIRFRVGTVVLPQGLNRTTYIGGYQVIPEDVKTAVMYLMSDQFQVFANPYGATSVSQGKRRVAFAMQKNKTLNRLQAEAYLSRYVRRV